MFRAAIAAGTRARAAGQADPRPRRARPRRAHGRADPRAARRAGRGDGFVLDGFPRNAGAGGGARRDARRDRPAARRDPVLRPRRRDRDASGCSRRARDEGRADDTPEGIAQRLARLPRARPSRSSSTTARGEARAAARGAHDQGGLRRDRRTRSTPWSARTRMIIRKSPRGDRDDGRGRRARRRDARARRRAVEPGVTTARARPHRRRVHPLARRRPDVEGIQGLPAAICISPNDDGRARDPGRVSRRRRAT